MRLRGLTSKLTNLPAVFGCLLVLDQHIKSVSSLRQLQHPWDDWEYVVSCCFRLSSRIGYPLAFGLEPREGGFFFMRHRHLKEGFEDTPMAVEDVLNHGTVADWRELAARVRHDPYGATAQSLRKVLVNTYMYGTTRIWLDFLEKSTGEHLEISHKTRKKWAEAAKYGY